MSFIGRKPPLLGFIVVLGTILNCVKNCFEMASVLSGVAGLVTGVAITLYLFPKQQILTIESKPDKSEIPFGAPSPSEVVKRYRGFDVSYDRRVKMASWAYEKITAVSIRGDAKRTNKFFPDRSEVDSFRVAPVSA